MGYQIDIAKRVFHFKQPAGTSRGTYTTRTSWFLTVTDELGRQGTGECAPLPRLSCDDFHTCEEKISSLVESVECRVESYDYTLAESNHNSTLYTLHSTLKSLHSSLKRLAPFPSLLFAFESAFHQLYSEQSPLYQTAFARGEQGISINGLVWMGTYDEMLARIDEKIRAGFGCVKLKIGAIDFERELDLIRHIRRHFTRQEIELRVDANGAFAPGEALEKLKRLAEHDLHSIEQPIRAGQWQEMARLCELSPLPIALDEELIGVHSADEKAALLDTIRPAYIILKPSLHGGMSGSVEWIELARQRGIGSWMTSALESNVGLSAIARLAAWVYQDEEGQVPMFQGLGTGQLFTDNIPMPLEIRGDRLWTLKQ